MNCYFFKHVSKEIYATKHHHHHFMYFLFCEKSPEATSEATHGLGVKRHFTLYLLWMTEKYSYLNMPLFVWPQPTLAKMIKGRGKQQEKWRERDTYFPSTITYTLGLGGPMANTVLPMQKALVQPLVRELDPTCHSEDSHVMQLRLSTAK